MDLLILLERTGSSHLYGIVGVPIASGENCLRLWL